jgi:hypothetical protein
MVAVLPPQPFHKQDSLHSDGSLKHLANSIRSWLSRNQEPSADDMGSGVHIDDDGVTSKAPSKFPNDTQVEFQQDLIGRGGYEENKHGEESITGICKVGLSGSSSDTHENVRLGTSSSYTWEYRGHSVPAILDMFLQQEALQFLSPPHLPTPHTHALDCYPPQWQNILRADSAHTCYSAAELDPRDPVPLPFSSSPVSVWLMYSYI